MDDMNKRSKYICDRIEEIYNKTKKVNGKNNSIDIIVLNEKPNLEKWLKLYTIPFDKTKTKDDIDKIINIATFKYNCSLNFYLYIPKLPFFAINDNNLILYTQRFGNIICKNCKYYIDGISVNNCNHEDSYNYFYNNINGEVTKDYVEYNFNVFGRCERFEKIEVDKEDK